MNKYQMDNIWQIMKEYDFETVDNIEYKLDCDLCKHLLIDSRIAPCGCRFCKICIDKYLSGNNKYCPANKNECGKEIWNLENFNIDYVTNMSLFKLIVKCPIKGCNYKDRIDKIEEHLIICTQEAIKCPYWNIGCKFITLNGKSVNLHCENQKDDHMKMFALELDNVKRENKGLLNQNKSLNDKLNEKQIYIDKLEQEKTETIKIETNFKEKQKKNISELELKTKNLDQTLIKKSKEMIESQNIVNDQLKKINCFKTILSGFLKNDKKEFIWTIDNFPAIIIANGQSLKSDFYHPYDNLFKVQMSVHNSNNNYQLYINFYNKEYLNNEVYTFDCDLTYGIFCEKSGFFSKHLKYKISIGYSNAKTFEFLKSDIPESAINNKNIIIKCIMYLFIKQQ